MRRAGVPTAQSVSCTTKDPGEPDRKWLRWSCRWRGAHGLVSDVRRRRCAVAPVYKKFTSQDELGHFLVDHYKIRTPKDLTSCEVCHR
jgi:hypothetical protein